jgi:ubiquinone/menaquinone biosynthesis C-methylase UbiE
MLAQCERRIATDGHFGVRLLMADAHRLPFAGATFDRVFHVGGIGGFRDPRQALAEMARVAVPGTPIVVVDEQLEPGVDHSSYHRLMFRLLTFYDSDPHCPAELLPPGARDVVQEAVSRFYYCLTFRVSECAGSPAL